MIVSDDDIRGNLKVSNALLFFINSLLIIECLSFTVYELLK